MSRMVLNGVVLASLIAGSSFSSAASAATPTITSAQLTDSTVVISGANFGTKAVAAPFFYQDFTTNNGVKDADLLIGYANQRQRAHNLDFLAHEVISKPFTLEEITRRISTTLAA